MARKTDIFEKRQTQKVVRKVEVGRKPSQARDRGRGRLRLSDVSEKKGREGEGTKTPYPSIRLNNLRFEFAQVNLEAGRQRKKK